MKELARLGVARAIEEGAGYADIRIVRHRQESIEVKNGHVEAVSDSESEGFGIRVIAHGSWGFAASSKLSLEELSRVAKLAVRIAKASSEAGRQRVSLAPSSPVQGSYCTPIKRSPFEVPLREKTALLMEATRAMLAVEGVKVAEGAMEFTQEDKLFASSEGSLIEQRIVHAGGGIAATAVRGDEVQKRSFPSSFGGDFRAAGYEHIEGLQLTENAHSVAQEAVALLDAPPLPAGTRDLVLGSAQLALQVHESCGHPIELDRVLGTEISLAGGSFLTQDKLGGFRYGSEHVNITADACIPGGLGTFGWDDEGVAAVRTDIVKNGIFSGYLTSRETAAQTNQAGSNGTMRAESWNRIPLIRMTNINLEPGDWDLDKLLRDSENGIFMETTKSWSIDDQRLNFHFGTEAAYEISGGKLGKLYKNPTYTGITPEFWASCDAVCAKSHWHVWGVPNCGKGEPMQTMHVGHGTSPARFCKVKVGAANGD
ncbi:MAG: TldD/PmbA family protein [Firmicutes bacterium]|nr:TldD/PmbA family protein [Bacillota bacterium]